MMSDDDMVMTFRMNYGGMQYEVKYGMIFELDVDAVYEFEFQSDSAFLFQCYCDLGY